MRALLLLWLLLGTTVQAGSPSERPRVVSMNVCTDQLAQLLAAPGQLVSVTWLARDPALNPLAVEAQAIPINQGTAESVLPLRPDVVLAGVTTTRATVELMRKLGWTVVEVTPASRIEEAISNIRLVAGAIKREDEGEALIATIESGLAETQRPRASMPESVALYAAGGRVAGSASLSADVVRHVGKSNLGDRFGPFGGSVSVEELLLERPALLVVSPHREDRPSLAQMALAHPALQTSPASRRVDIPASLWNCDGPGIVDAARLLNSQAP